MNSIMSLARIYENGGEGIEKNNDASIRWYSHSAIKGCKYS